MNECLPRGRRPEDTFKYLWRRLVESQEDAPRRCRQKATSSVLQEDAVRRHLQAFFKKTSCLFQEDAVQKTPPSVPKEGAAMKKRLKFDPSDNFKYLSRRRCHEEKVEDWKWKLEVIMNITFNARQKCYYSYWQMQSQSPSTLQQHNGQTWRPNGLVLELNDEWTNMVVLVGGKCKILGSDKVILKFIKSGEKEWYESKSWHQNA